MRMNPLVMFGALAGVLALSATGSDHMKVSREYTFRIPDFTTASYPDSDAAVNDVVANHIWVEREVVGQLEHHHLSNEQRTYAIYLVGRLRANRAVPWLIEHIDFKAERLDPRLRLGRWSEFPAADALVAIRTSEVSRGLVQSLATEDDARRAALMIRVIREVDGREVARSRLDTAIATETNATRRDRLRSALELLSNSP